MALRTPLTGCFWWVVGCRFISIDLLVYIYWNFGSNKNTVPEIYSVDILKDDISNSGILMNIWLKAIPGNIRLDQDVFKTSWSRPTYLPWPYVFNTSSRRFQDDLKTFCQDIFKMFSNRLQDVFQKRPQDVFKRSSKHLQDVLQRCLKTFSKCIIRLICLPGSHVWRMYGQCRKIASVIKISQV